MATTADLAQARRRRPSRGTLREMRENVWPYIFISPFFILFAIFGLFPYLYALFLSFIRWDGISPMEWVGLANYQRLLTDDIWWKSVYNSVWLMVVTMLNLVIALVLAFILNSGLVRFKEVYRTAYFTPIVASAVAVSMVFAILFGNRYGTLNYFLGWFGIERINWLQSALWIKPAIATVVIWQYFGWNTVIYLAGLQSIPTDLYEAARVDGARWRDIFFHVTIPLLRPVITFTVILSIIGGLQLFEHPMMLAGGTQSTSPGGPDRAGLTVMVYLYSTAFQWVQFGYAAAISVALFIIIVVFSFIYYRVLGGGTPE